MHFFELRDIQHYILALLPALLGIILFGVGLAFTYFRRGRAEVKPETYHTYPDGIVDERGPFPLVLILTIGGTLLWAFFYILFIGLREVKF